MQRLAGADVDRERHEVGAVELDARPVGLDGEDVARGRSAVDLDVVAAVVAVRDVGAVAVVPHQRVVAGAAVHRVGAAVADDAVVAAAAAEDVVALAAEDQVRPVGAVHRVHAGAAVDRQQRERAHAVAGRDRVVAAEPVDLEALGRGVERERPQVRPLELDPAGVRARA